jgi:NAD(P)H-dependent FMN reductase
LAGYFGGRLIEQFTVFGVFISTLTNPHITLVRIAILSSSTRINRQSHRVALGLAQYLTNNTSHTPDVLDLAAYNFPIMEEVIYRLSEVPDGLQDFAERLRAADACIFVSPEYNGSYTSALKNAVDYLKENEFTKKVIGVASVTSGPMGGMRAALAMQQLVLGVGGFAIPQMLTVGSVAERFDEAGNMTDPAFDKKMRFFMDGFLWLAEAVTERKGALAV